MAFANIIASRNKNDDANLGAKRSSFDPTKHVPPKISSFGFNVFASPKDAGRQNILGDSDFVKNLKMPAGWGTNDIERKNPTLTKTELLQKRRSEVKPHISFDLDGDGVVGNRDYVLAKLFDKDQDGRLNTQERRAADDAIRNVSQLFTCLPVWF